MKISRRGFVGGALGFAVAGGAQLFATESAVAVNCVPPWKKGEFQIHFIHTGVGESQFLIFPDGTTMLLDCPGNPAVCLGRAGVPILPSARLHAGEWVAKYVQRVSPNKTDVDYLAISHFHQDHGGGISYHKGVTKWKGGDPPAGAMAAAGRSGVVRGRTRGGDGAAGRQDVHGPLRGRRRHEDVGRL